MAYRTASILACSLLVGIVAGAKSPAAVEIPDRSTEKLEELATHIVTADVVSIYDREVEARSWATTHHVAEVRVKSVENGALADDDGLIYVRYWQRAWVGGGHPPTSTNGHRGLPAEGDSVRIYLAQDAYDGFGGPNEDGGFNVLGPNGFARLEAK